MKFDPLLFRPWRSALAVLVVLGATGLALRPLEAPAWNALKSTQPALKLDSIQGALGQGVTVGLLGGFRAIVADFFWLKTNSVWSDNDLPATQTYVHLVTAIDPRPLYFWLNGSRMIAYDMPNWRIQAAGGYDDVPQGVQRRIDEEQSRVGVDYLKEGFGHHPDEPLLYIEIANIYLNRLKDNATAGEYYLKAARQPDAPHYAARIYAELLRRMDRNVEAYAWLKELYLTLPKGPDAPITAQADVVLERIRELETELSIPADQAFQP